MKILAVDTSSATATVAIMSDKVLIGEYILNSGKTHSQKLMVMIERLLDDCSILPSEIDVYACSSGPGSFTGLRIGAATIKGMAQAFDKPVIGIPSLDILAYGLYDCNDTICSALDAQRGMVYAALYQFTHGKLNKLEDLKVIAIDALIKHVSEKYNDTVIVGEGALLFEDKLQPGSKLKTAASINMLPRASSCAALAQILAEEGKYNTYEEFIPQYIRKSQAEVEYAKKLQIEICDMKLEDVDAVYNIEKLSFKTPWSKEAFADEMQKNTLAKYIVAKVEDNIIGYGGMWIILDEGHITNIAVHPDYRGQGIGDKLVQTLVKKAKESNAQKMTLEVRKSNTPARSLYKKYGFIDFGIRRGYYHDTGEDAVIMWRDI